MIIMNIRSLDSLKPKMKILNKKKLLIEIMKRKMFKGKETNSKKREKESKRENRTRS